MTEPTVTVPLSVLEPFLERARRIAPEWANGRSVTSLTGPTIGQCRALLAAVETPDISEDPIKAAYQRGWNDREGDLLVGVDRIYGPTSDTLRDAVIAALKAAKQEEAHDHTPRSP